MRGFRGFLHGVQRGEHDDGLGGGQAEGGEARGAHRGGRGRPGGGRVFGHGGLRFVLLQLIAHKPGHGYEFIKAIEERLGGSYSPSPGIVYPTLTLLEEMGCVSVDAADGGGRKRYSITPVGLKFLADNRKTTDELMARMSGGVNGVNGVDGAGPRAGRPPQVVRAIENLKLAMRLRLSGEPLTQQQAHEFAAVLDSAAQQLERI